MINILETIIAHKRMEIARGKLTKDIAFFEQQPLFMKPRTSLKDSVEKKKGNAIIAEFKRKSPSAGIINDMAVLKEVVEGYKKYGAAGISILTDELFFGGTLHDLEEAQMGSFPLLRKDFIIDEWQLYEAKASGADAVLLIAACLSKDEVKNLARKAKDLELEILLELHDEKELAHLCSNIDMVGVNNRNLGNFSVNLEHSVNMAEKLGKDIIKIVESGIGNIDDVRFLQLHGFDGFLVGSLFMKQNDPGQAFRTFINDLIKT
jgi:indole-3-glycerol phosphate synthase